MLPLDSKRWAELYHAYGNASDVPEMIRKLRRTGEQERWINFLWDEIGGSLCHQGTVYTATYAIVPYLVKLLRFTDEFQKFNLIALLGWIAGSRDRVASPADLEADYKDSIKTVAGIGRELLLSQNFDQSDYIWLLDSVAGLHECFQPDTKLNGLTNEQYEAFCPFCKEFLMVAVRESGFYSYAVDDSWKPITDEIEVIARNGIDEPWNNVIDCQDNFRWLYGISRMKGHNTVCSWLRCLYGETTCPICNKAFNLMKSFEQ